jgi:hypothetical protein
MGDIFGTQFFALIFFTSRSDSAMASAQVLMPMISRDLVTRLVLTLSGQIS